MKRLYTERSMIIGSILSVLIIFLAPTFFSKNISFMIAIIIFILTFFGASYKVWYDIYSLKVKLPELQHSILERVHNNDQGLSKDLEKFTSGSSEHHSEKYINTLKELKEEGFITYTDTMQGIFNVEITTKGRKYVEGRLFLNS